MTPKSAAPLDVLRRFAPGTALRDAVEIILRQGSGALIVIGSGPEVDGVSTGGFRLDDAPFTAQRVAELAKMDGGIVVDDGAGFIDRANVHFIPDATIRTDETGTRFRTAERLALQTGRPVLAVSEEGRRFAVVYTNGDRFVLQDPTSLLAEANQRLQSLERLRRQLDEAEERLTRYEIDDVVVLRDAVVVIQRAALILRLLGDLETIAVELGDEASLIRIQASDLASGVELLAELVNYDYQARRPRKGTSVFAKLDELAPEELYHTATVGAALGLVPLDEEGSPRGARALARIPRLPVAVRDGLIRRFGSLRRLLGATVDELSSVEGVGTVRAKQVKTHLNRLDEVRLSGDFAD